MKKTILFFLLSLSFVTLPQGKHDRMNANIFYLMVYDLTFSKPAYHIMTDAAKIKAAGVKKMEVTKGWTYIVDPSIPDVKGIEGYDRKDIIEFDKNGNPLKYSHYSYTWDPALLEATFTYDKEGAITATSIASKDTAGKVIYWAGKYKFNYKSGKLASVNYEEDPEHKGRGSLNSYDFTYRPDGTLEKITLGSEAMELIKGDEKGRIGTLLLYGMSYTYSYDANSRVTKESIKDDYGDKWDMIYKYDAKGNLLSVKSSGDIVFEEMNYTVGKDGFPLKAKLKYETKSSGRAVNYEFRYTK